MGQAERTNAKERIAFIDLMKGIVVLLILVHHLGFTEQTEWLKTVTYNLRLPSFFFIAGLFISHKYTTRAFIIKKVNNLLVPYAFFGLIMFAVALYIPDMIMPGIKDYHIEMTRQGLYRFFAHPANLPTWFLWALFYASIIFFAISKTLRHRHWLITIFTITAIGIGGRMLSHYMLTHMNQNSLMTFLRYTHFSIGLESAFYLMAGYMFRNSSMFAYNPKDKTRSALILLALTLWLLAANGVTSYYWYNLANPLYTSYVAGLSGVAVVWLMAQRIGYLPYVSYVGRYSIITLGTHWVYHVIMRGIGITSPYIELAVILALLPPTIYVLTRYLPWLTAQRPLIPVPGERRRAVETAAPAFGGTIAGEGQELGAENLRKL